MRNLSIDSANKTYFVLGSQYFLFFGVLGIFLPYFNLYCYHIGFSGFQIGILSGLRSMILVLFSLIWSALADRFQIRKPLYILCHFLSTALWIFYIFTSDFLQMLVITFFFGIFYSPIISFLEAVTIDSLGNEKKKYGGIRAWGSLGFILMVILFGKMIDLFTIEIILVSIFVGSLLQSFISITIPAMTIKKKPPMVPETNALLKGRIVIFLVCAFLMLVSHGTYYGFFSIHLENLGYGNSFIGMTWALASSAEILVMIKSNRIFKRFSLENVLKCSFIVAAARWFVLFVAKSPLAILSSQISHAITYGTFHMASILYIDSLAPDRAKTLAQAVNNAVTYGLGLMTGFFISGALYERVGSNFLFMASGFIALSGGILFWCFPMVDRQSKKPAPRSV